MSFWHGRTSDIDFLNIYLEQSKSWIARESSGTEPVNFCLSSLSCFPVPYHCEFVSLLEWLNKWRSAFMEKCASSDGNIYQYPIAIGFLCPIFSYVIALFLWHKCSNFKKKKILKERCSVTFRLKFGHLIFIINQSDML